MSGSTVIINARRALAPPRLRPRPQHVRPSPAGGVSASAMGMRCAAAHMLAQYSRVLVTAALALGAARPRLCGKNATAATRRVDGWAHKAGSRRLGRVEVARPHTRDMLGGQLRVHRRRARVWGWLRVEGQRRQTEEASERAVASHVARLWHDPSAFPRSVEGREHIDAGVA